MNYHFKKEKKSCHMSNKCSNLKVIDLHAILNQLNPCLPYSNLIGSQNLNSQYILDLKGTLIVVIRI